MSASSERELKRHLGGVKNVRQITSAMRAVASARMQRAKKWMQNARAFGRETSRAIRSLIVRHSSFDHPFFLSAEEGLVPEDQSPGYLIFTSDRGLCGSFNTNVYRKVEKMLQKPGDAHLYLVGNRGIEYFTREGAPVEATFEDVWESQYLETSGAIRDRVCKDFKKGKVTSITMIYNEFETAMRQRVLDYPLLPLNREEFIIEIFSEGLDYHYDPEPKTVIDAILPYHVYSQIFMGLLESYASERGARMTAMEQATESADEMLEELEHEFNQLRQQNITREIAEISGAAEAL